MKNALVPFFSLLSVLTNTVSSPAQPVLNRKELLSNVAVFPDLKNKFIYYYPPGDLRLGLDNYGKPELKFVQMRYTGSQATGDQGKFNSRSILQLTIRMKNYEGDQLRDIAALLEKKAGGPVRLYPLPVRNMQALLLYASVSDNGTAGEKTQPVFGGSLENPPDASQAEAGEYWNERTYTVSLDPHSSQIFWTTLDKGMMALSVAFYYFVDGVLSSPEYSIEISGHVDEEIRQQIRQFATDSLADSTGKSILFKADAFSISVDTRKYPDLVKKIDINETFTPPDFAVLDVRCYDFNNDLRPDLYAKRIELEAAGMNGEPVKQKITFYSSEPDIYHAGVRFKYAVRMDKPFRYRVIEINNDIAPVYGNWITAKSWTKVIDITTKK